MDLVDQNNPKRSRWSAGESRHLNRKNSTMTDIVGNVARTTSTRRSSQKQQPRRISSMSESITSAQSQGSALLEEWPRRDSYIDTDLDEMSLCSLKSYKEVSFSEYSTISVYLTHEVERKKSYTSVEIKGFKNLMRLDVIRVTELIAASPYNCGPALCHLIHTKALTPEELIGIDHLLCDEDAARKIAFERFAYSKLVLKKQVELQPQELAGVAIERSNNSVQKALIRAKMAAIREKEDETAEGVDNLSRVNAVRGVVKSDKRFQRSLSSAAA